MLFVLFFSVCPALAQPMVIVEEASLRAQQPVSAIPATVSTDTLSYNEQTLLTTAPNPASDVLYVTLARNVNLYGFHVRDNLGRLIFSTTGGLGTYTLPSGTTGLHHFYFFLIDEVVHSAVLIQ